MHAADRVCFNTDMLRTTVLGSLLSLFVIVNFLELWIIRSITKYLSQKSREEIWHNIKVKLHLCVIFVPF